MPHGEHDLVALVIELRAEMKTYIGNHLGRAIQWLALTLIGNSNAALADELHSTEELKPLTISGLMHTRPTGTPDMLFGPIREDQTAWVRITGLSAPVAQALQAAHQQFQTQLQAGERCLMELDRIPWRITGTFLEDTPWAGQSSYQTLIARQTNANPQHHLTINFITPTTFRSQTINMPLPLPSLVFGSLLSRWIAFTPHRLRDLPQDQLDLFIAHHILISQHQIETSLIRGKQGGKEIGFTGWVTYEFAPTSEYLLKQNPVLEAHLQREYVWFVRTMGLLADYAFYSSVGRKTTTGLGMARDGRR